MATFDEDECWRRLRTARHGVIATLHPERGADVVPVVFAVLAERIVVPVDTVKPKRRTRLSRLDNLERDPRCVLLVEHYEDDWSRLWWVRVHAVAEESGISDEMRSALEARYPQYRAPETLASGILLAPTAVTGWGAASSRGGD